MSSVYEAYRSNKIESGLRYQDFIVDYCGQALSLIIQLYSSQTYQYTVGESKQGYEIKHDEKYASTGNLWIEVAEKARPRSGDYVSSGIRRNDNSWLYIIGDYDTVFIFAITHLRMLEESGRYVIQENRTKTSKGFCLADRFAQRVAIKVLKPKAKARVDVAIQDLEAAGRELHRLVLSNPAQGSLFSRGTEE